MARAAEALGREKDIRAIPCLIRVLEDQAWLTSLPTPFLAFGMHEVDWRDTVKIRIIQALGEIGDGRAVEPLLKQLALTRTWGPSWETLWWALRRIGDSRCIAPLLQTVPNRKETRDLLHHIDPKWAESESARSAVQSLVGRLREDAPGYLDSSDASLRCVDEISYTALLLGEIGDTSTIGPLLDELTRFNSSFSRSRTLRPLATLFFGKQSQ